MSKFSALLKTAFRVTGKRVLHRRRQTSTPALPNAWSEVLHQVADSGIAIIPDFWDVRQCQDARDQFEQLILQQRGALWHDNTASDVRIFGFDRLSGLGDEFLSNPAIRDIKQAYYGADPDLLEEFVMINKVVCRPGNLGSGGGWHRDAVHEQQLKAILYLSDVAEENGAFQYLVNTHQKSSIYRTIQDNNIAYSQNRFTEAEISDILKTHGDDYPLATATGKAGTLILADTSGIHRGSPIREGDRYAMTQYIYRSTSIGGKGIPPQVVAKLEGRVPPGQ